MTEYFSPVRINMYQPYATQPYAQETMSLVSGKFYWIYLVILLIFILYFVFDCRETSPEYSDVCNSCTQ